MLEFGNDHQNFHIQKLSINGFWYLSNLENFISTHCQTLNSITLGETDGLQNSKKSNLWKALKMCKNLSSLTIFTAEIVSRTPVECQYNKMFENAVREMSLTSLTLPKRCCITSEDLLSALDSATVHLENLEICQSETFSIIKLLSCESKVRNLKSLTFWCEEYLVTKELLNLLSNPETCADLQRLSIVSHEGLFFSLFEFAHNFIVKRKGSFCLKLIPTEKSGEAASFLSEITVQVILAGMFQNMDVSVEMSVSNDSVVRTVKLTSDNCEFTMTNE